MKIINIFLKPHNFYKKRKKNYFIIIQKIQENFIKIRQLQNRSDEQNHVKIIW